MKNLRSFENFQIYIHKSQWKTDYFHFLSHPPGPLSFYTPLEHTKKFFRWFGGSSAGMGAGGDFTFGGLDKPLGQQDVINSFYLNSRNWTVYLTEIAHTNCERINCPISVASCTGKNPPM